MSKEKRCKDCEHWLKTDDRANILNPSGKCNGRWNGKDDGWGIHANQLACYDFKKLSKPWEFWRPK